MLSRSLILVGAVLLTLVPASSANMARCTGSAGCRACSSCSSCGHCAKQGGSCGVCSRRTTETKPAATPRTTTPRKTPARTTTEQTTTAVSLAPTPKETIPEPSNAAAFEDGIAVFFSPKGYCTDAIVEQITNAQTSVQVQAYRLTSIPIAKALVAARGRGVVITILLDKRQQSDKYSDATYFHNHGMTVFIDTLHAIAHNKVMIVDGKTVLTGSFNFSEAAEENNAENLLIIQGDNYTLIFTFQRAVIADLT